MTPNFRRCRECNEMNLGSSTHCSTCGERIKPKSERELLAEINEKLGRVLDELDAD